jgi:bacterial/archaeal transporter family-2 protein
MNWIAYFFAAAAGAANPVQAGANAELNRSLAAPIWAALYVYVSGLAGVLALGFFLREQWPAMSRVAQTPWWAWLGGAISIASTIAGLSLVQRLGSGVFSALTVTSSLATSMLLDNFGWLGFRVRPLTPFRLVGTLLMVAGVWLVTRF